MKDIDPLEAAERLELATRDQNEKPDPEYPDEPRPSPINTHELAQFLLALPALDIEHLRQQGAPEAWSGQLHSEVEVQVGIRSW